MLKQMLAVVIVSLLSFHSWAENCRTDTLDVSTPTSRFSTEGVTVTDKDTTLSWMRCAVGQSWNGETCTGKAKKLDWQQAMALVAETNSLGYAGHADWRMPMVPELASIVERQCFNPRINSVVFPGAPSEIFWSSMEKIGSTVLAYTLDFGGGQAVASAKTNLGAIRLVRGGPWWEPPVAMQQ